MNDLPTILSEISVMETEMGDRSSPYWKEPERQSRYRDLVTRKQAMTAAPMPSIIDNAVLPIASQAEYQTANSTMEGYDRYLDTMRVAADVVQAVPDADRGAFIQSFEALPDSVAHAICTELTLKSHAASIAMPEQVDRFASRPEGAVMVREWGAQAGRKLGLIRARFERIIGALDERGALAFLRWFEGLSGGASIAVYRKLTA